MRKPPIILQFKKAHYYLVCLFTIIVFSCKDKTELKTAALPIKQLELNYKDDLNLCIANLDSLLLFSNKNSVTTYYLKSRNHFKKAEAILAFSNSENYKALNGPNILKVEEEDATDIKYMQPFGFQAIEELIHENTLDKSKLETVVLKTKNRLEFIANNTQLKFEDYHILWLIRDQIIRIALTGITGFDSPVFERSLTEAKISYKSIQDILNIYKVSFKSDSLYNAWETEISMTLERFNDDFESFDRFIFIKDHTNKQLELILKTKSIWGVEFPYKLAFNNDLTSLFSSNTFNIRYFSSEKFDTLSLNKIKLGKKLFNETALSKENNMSCATCHQSSSYFTDGKIISDHTTRNSPTLLYAALQKSFFYDNRAGSLEGQIVSVVKNENEFHTNLDQLEKVVKKDSMYVQLFLKTYKDSVTQNNVRNAIATYIRSLTPFNSKFDNNINGLENTLTKSEINGFNIFMGKAKCATCHFPPIFNGTVPVTYKESEMELIGVPKTNDTINTMIDDDLGAYNVYHTEAKKHFFKTPTVRNINQTGPYMHNGVFNTLEEVIAFYNRGGGIGLDLDLKNQTLPPNNLGLSSIESQDLIAFMKSLDDSL